MRGYLPIRSPSKTLDQIRMLTRTYLTLLFNQKHNQPQRSMRRNSPYNMRVSPHPQPRYNSAKTFNINYAVTPVHTYQNFKLLSMSQPKLSRTQNHHHWAVTRTRNLLHPSMTTYILINQNLELPSILQSGPYDSLRRRTGHKACHNNDPNETRLTVCPQTTCPQSNSAKIYQFPGGHTYTPNYEISKAPANSQCVAHPSIKKDLQPIGY